MFRRYLVTIHKFYAHAHGGAFNYPLMPAIVAGVTIVSFFAGIDMSLNNSRMINELMEIHRFAAVVVIYVVIFSIYFYYKSRQATQQELRNSDGKWIGVLICIASVLFAMVASI